MAAKSASKAAPQARARAGKSREVPKRSGWKRRIKLGLAWLTILFCLAFVVCGAIFYSEIRWAESELPKLETRILRLASNPSEIVSADGKVIYREQVEYRKPAKFEDLPKHVRDATLAAEDIRFYEHEGVDWRAILRALFVNVREGRVAEGGSTLTMQFAKQIGTSPEKSFRRKLKDMALAIQIENHYTKDQILTLYLNQVYYGSGAYGIGAAASVYFGKSIKDLTIAEAALLARVPRRPSEENPFDDPDAALRNRRVVLRRMLEAGMITQEQFAQADAEPLKLQPRHFGSGARRLSSPYFVDYVLDGVKQEVPGIDLTQGGYRIETTLISELDDAAYNAVKEVVRKYSKQKLTTGAFMLMDYEGRILAMVGGVDHNRNEYNVIYKGHRQPGSAFKPFVYATALSLGVVGPNDRISNEQLIVEKPDRTKVRWPKNATPSYGGDVSIATAIARSINVPAAHVCEMAGPQNVVRYCRDVFGFRSPLDPVLAIALGASAVKPLEMAQGYGVFMLGGDRVRPFGIRRIIGPDGTVIREFEPQITRGVLDPRVAQLMDGYLRGVVTGGTGWRAKSVPNARGKTGTTSDHRDAWFCGYTNSLVGVSWVASERFDGREWVYDPMNRVFGGTVAVEIWTRVMKEAVKLYEAQEALRSRRNEPPADLDSNQSEPPIDDVAGGDRVPLLPPPNEATRNGGTSAPPSVSEGATTPPPSPDTVEVEICAESQAVANPYCPETVTRKFERGKEPMGRCPIHGPLL